MRFKVYHFEIKNYTKKQKKSQKNRGDITFLKKMGYWSKIFKKILFEN